MINLKEEKARIFLEKFQIKNCAIKKIAGDASFRSYYRIFRDDKNYILMFAPPGYEDINSFAKIDNFLVKEKFSAPRIYASDEENGFLLLEDFGDKTYGKVLSFDKSQELDLYQKACDVLLKLHKVTYFPNIPIYDNSILFREVMLFADWYLLLRNKKMSLEERAEYKFIWFQLFDRISKENQVLVLRDYHADNLMIVEGRDGYQSVGLLDFQDALIGSRAYDLVSLLEDARRDVDDKNRQKLFNFYLRESGCDRGLFFRDYEIFSLQRNIKILGIFARLSMRDGKHQYLDLLPRVLAFVKARLASSDKNFSEMKDFFKKFI